MSIKQNSRSHIPDAKVGQLRQQPSKPTDYREQPSKPSTKQQFKGKEKPVPGNTKPKKWDAKNSAFKVPSRLLPKMTETQLGRPAFIEYGGIINNQNPSIIQGCAQIICNSKGEGKHPICIFDKMHFESPQLPQSSLVFYTRPGDYVISEFHRSPTEELPGIVIIHINRVAYLKKKDGSVRNNPPRKEDLGFKLITNIVIPIREATMKHGFKHMISKKIDISNNSIINRIITKTLKEINTPFLLKAIVQCVEKSNNEKTSYALYRRSKLADRYSDEANVI
jgi:hypothetical protein